MAAKSLFDIKGEETLGGNLQTRIKNRIKGLFQSGKLRGGDRIPPVRKLVSSVGASHAIVARAISSLIEDGILESHGRRGVFVSGELDSLKLSPKAKGLLFCVPIPLAKEAVAASLSWHELALGGAEERASELGAALFRISAGECSDLFKKLSAMNAKPDGFLLTTRSSPDFIRDLLKSGAPCVRYGAESEDLQLESVTSDNVEAGALAARALLAEGHERIVFAGSPGDSRFMNRYLGMKAELLRQQAETGAEEWPLKESLDDLPSLLRRRKSRPTAIIAGNDMVAAAVFDGFLKPAGLRVPQDLSLIGFDDLGFSSPELSLSSVSFDKKALGRMALDRLVYRTEHPFEAACTTLVRPFLVARGSVAAPCART